MCPSRVHALILQCIFSLGLLRRNEHTPAHMHSRAQRAWLFDCVELESLQARKSYCPCTCVRYRDTLALMESGVGRRRVCQARQCRELRECSKCGVRGHHVSKVRSIQFIGTPVYVICMNRATVGSHGRTGTLQPTHSLRVQYSVLAGLTGILWSFHHLVRSLSSLKE